MRNNLLEFDKGYCCKICEYIINKQKHQVDKKVRRHDQYFSNRLPYANKKIRETQYSMVNSTYNSTQEMINKLQCLKCKTKLNFYENISNFCDNMNIRMDEDPFARNTQGIGKFYQEVILLMKFLQTKLSVKNMNITYYDLYYTVIKNKDDKEIVDDRYEKKRS